MQIIINDHPPLTVVTSSLEPPLVLPEARIGQGRTQIWMGLGSLPLCTRIASTPREARAQAAFQVRTYVHEVLADYMDQTITFSLGHLRFSALIFPQAVLRRNRFALTPVTLTGRIVVRIDETWGLPGSGVNPPRYHEVLYRTVAELIQANEIIAEFIGEKVIQALAVADGSHVAEHPD